MAEGDRIPERPALRGDQRRSVRWIVFRPIPSLRAASVLLPSQAIMVAIKDGSKSAYDIEIRANSASFFTGKFLPGLALVLRLKLPVGRGCVGAEF